MILLEFEKEILNSQKEVTVEVSDAAIFVYETDFNRYQVMDGLQRITAIIDFYNDYYELEELTQWSELNGKKYSQLPQKVKEGIDRRQLSVITLLKESSKTLIQEEEMKKMVFERLNTGGVTLEDQEIRNALYNGPFNDLCISLSSNKIFRKLWDVISELEYTEKVGNKTLNLSLQYSKIIKQAVESPIQYNTVIISIYGCFEQYIDNIFNEYCHALYAIIENYDLTDKQAVKNAVEAFDNPKVGLGNNQELILTHGGNLKIILPVLIIKGYYYIREIICWQSKMIELKY